MKIVINKAKRIVNNDKNLSKKDFIWNVPKDLIKLSTKDKFEFRTFIGIGRWDNNNKPFACVVKEGKIIYLEKEIVEILYNSIKDLNDAKEEKDVGGEE